METSPQDRFAALCPSALSPAASDANHQHLFEIEQDSMRCSQPKTAWRIPDAPQVARTVRKPAPKMAGGDPVKSSDEVDDYLSAFVEKPKVTKKTNIKPKPRTLPEPNAHGYPKDAYIEPKQPLAYLPQGKSSYTAGDGGSITHHPPRSLPTTDHFGNSVIGHFCPAHLVKTFPYKYMKDDNNRVSKRFFASDKFFERNWDL
jgi:hypothetical protein